nr:hypothetical protein [Mycobacteroides abscessus]
MADYLSFNVDEVIGLYEVDAMIAAANSVPEGAPVGTIARRPDGEAVAIRVQGDRDKFWGSPHWSYKPLYDSELFAEEPTDADDADSWPVIYDPTGKTLDELHAEIDRLDKAEDSALRERDYWEETVNRILYTCSSVNEIGEWSSANDPVERFIEQFRPVKRIDPTAQQEPGKSNESQSSVDFDVTAQQEPAIDFVADHQQRVKFKDATGRKPRVVDRLGVDEQGSRWRDRDGDEWKYQNGWRWRECPDIWAVGNPSPTYAPYTEILEPRVLPSLDCEEARDGTVWSPVDGRIGRRYKFVSGSWKSKVGDEEWYTLRSMGLLEERFGPFTEVIE